MKINRVGHTLIEFLLCLILVLIGLASWAALIQSEWQRTRCAYLAFESAHLSLLGLSKIRANVQIHETSEWISAQAKCGRSVEKVTLPKLEAAKW